MVPFIFSRSFCFVTVRTRTHLSNATDIDGKLYLKVPVFHRFWRLSIPLGSTLDDPSANPFGPYSQSLAAVPLDPILVVAGGGEILRDRLEDYATRLRESGKKVEFVEFEGQQHGFFTDHPFSEVARKVIQRIADFMLENSN